MPRHAIHPLPRALHGRGRGETAGGPSGSGRGQDEDVWRRMDRVQVLGGSPGGGHRGCVNALSWSDDGSTLLSGSDDKRICIWAPDDAPTDSLSPHPMKLKDTILTGHRANIFSAKYLPNTSTPTIVSCAGDRDIRVFEVERLSRAEGMGERGRNELWGGDGDGVTVLRCHHDRTKRIATETSPFLFLTVSEDGTVRQHDLRRPHRCKSECPDPLFRAPRGVDLYSLSVSTVAPHMFAVAGRTDCAFICDRRMLERQTPSWGPHTKASGQVHCVRRLGLSEEDWKSVEPRSGSMYAGERHITCVKMSPERADEVICAFARHSTSLFSLYDSPGESSMRQPSSSPVQGTAKRRKSPRTASSSPSLPVDPAAAATPSIRPDEPSESHMVDSSMQMTDEEDADEAEEMDEEAEQRMEETFQQYRACMGLPPEPPGRSADDWAEVAARAIGGQQEEGEDSLADAGLGTGGPALRATPGGWADAGSVQPSSSTAASRAHDHQRLAAMLEADLDDEDMWEDEEGDGMELDSDGIANIDGEDDDDGVTDDDDDDEEDDEDDDGDPFDDSDNSYSIDDDQETDEEDMDADVDIYSDPRSGSGEYGRVPLMLPRRSYKGARNMETVKDCNFLGVRADKVCSGSDDGSWFVWDKETGRLEGLWEGDGDVVNVVEQHPTLPIVAVSGIDNTVKLFAPPSQPLPFARSFSRMQRAQEIMQRNMAQRAEPRARTTVDMQVLRFLQSRGIVIAGAGAVGGIGLAGAEDGVEEEGDEDGDEGGPGPQQCATQ